MDVNAPVKYETRGATIYGGDAKEIVWMPREVSVGEVFYANSHFYRVKMCGLLEQQYEGGQSTHLMLIEHMGFWDEFLK